MEVKHRQSLPAWLLDAMRQADASAEQLPVAVLHEHGNRHDRDLRVLRLADLATLLDDTNHPATVMTP
jgi:hypothetical protein